MSTTADPTQPSEAQSNENQPPTQAQLEAAQALAREMLDEDHSAFQQSLRLSGEQR